MKYFVSYKQAVPWNGSVFNANEYRKAINEFFSKVDLVNPNLKTDKDASLIFDVPVRDLSPDASFPNELTFDIGGYASTEKDEITGLFKSFVTLGGDVRVPRILSNGNTLRTIIAAGTKSINALGDTPEKSFFNGYKQLRESLVQTLADQISGSGKGIKVERQDAFTDPEPSLVGPPTQTIAGVTNKPPVVDNPNIKLPSQEVKALDVNAAQTAASKAQSVTSNVTSQAQGAVGGITEQAQGAVSQAQGAVGGITEQAQGAVSQAQGAVGGITEQAQGAVGQTQQSATGVLGNLSSGVKGALGGGVLGAGIGALAGGGKGALIGAGAGVLAGGIAGKVVDKLNPKGIVPDGLGKDWSPDKFSPEAIAGNDKFVDPKTGVIGSTSKLAAGLKGGLLGGGLGAGIGALTGGSKGALIGGLSGTALGAGAAVGGVTGGALTGIGLGTKVGELFGGNKGAVIGAVSGGVVGAAAAKLTSVQKGLPKPKIPKPTNLPRVKTVKLPNPNNTKKVTNLLNLPNSGLV